MDTWIIGKKAQLEKRRNEDGERVFTSIWYEGTKSGTSEQVIEITRLKDGAMTFSDKRIDGGFIYLYPEQVKHLRRILGMNAKRKRKD